MNNDVTEDLKLDLDTLAKRLRNPSYYPPHKREALALAVLERTLPVYQDHQAARELVRARGATESGVWLSGLLDALEESAGDTCAKKKKHGSVGYCARTRRNMPSWWCAACLKAEASRLLGAMAFEQARV